MGFFSTVDSQGGPAREGDAPVWPMLVSAAVLLTWIFGEVEWCLWHTSRFWALGLLLAMVAVLLAVHSTLTLVHSARADKASARASLMRAARTIYVLSLPCLAAAVITARLVNPSYDFRTPLLRLAAVVTSHMWR